MNNSENQKVIEDINNINNLITKGKYQEALNIFRILECSSSPNNKNIKINKLACLVNIGEGLKNTIIIQEGINAGEKCLEDSQNKEYEATIHYNLANGYSALYKLKREYLQKSKYHYREAIKTSVNLAKI